MKIIKTKNFTRWANKNDLSDQSIIVAAKEIAQDIYEANYGAGLIKKRIANKGRGKSGSARTIVAFKKGKDCFFIFGFEKNSKSNVSQNEEKAMKIVAKELFSYSAGDLNKFIKNGALIEVNYEQE